MMQEMAPKAPKASKIPSILEYGMILGTPSRGPKTSSISNWKRRPEEPRNWHNKFWIEKKLHTTARIAQKIVMSVS